MDTNFAERQALAHAEENLINTNKDDGMLPAASCSSFFVLYKVVSMDWFADSSAKNNR
jgi:hypothetical protein